MRQFQEKLLYGGASVAVVLALWWAVTARELVSPFILPSPALVLQGLHQIAEGYMGSSIFKHLGASLLVVLSGFGAAIVIGIPLGAAMAWNRSIETLFGPLITLLRPVPPPAWIPLAILWFGIGLGGKTFVVFLSAFVPCLMNAYTGIRETPPELLAAARTLGADRRTLFLEVALPSSLPVVMTGMRIALGNAWATVVAAELVVATEGLGFLIMNGYRNFESQIMAVGMIVIGVVGFLMNIGFRALEKRVVRWRSSDE
jgi:ABC-type nitrate/sulfonate/bicarbonate transport system permease component